MITVGERIKEARNRERMTAEALGKLLNVSKISVYRWESGQRQPDVETVKKIGEILSVSAAYLLGETDDPSSQIVQAIRMTQKTIATSGLNLSACSRREGIVIERTVGDEQVKVEIPLGGEHLIRHTLDAVWQSIDSKRKRDPKREKLHSLIDDLDEDLLDEAFKNLSSAQPGIEEEKDA
jgi:transcriptional regulator with XRE-family HTH domain